MKIENTWPLISLRKTEAETKLIFAANKIISFGKVTWPHKLVRIMLLEQLYRGITILKNHPYHRN